MLEEVYGIKAKGLIVTVCIYFITVIPGYSLLFERNKIGFFSILLIENIITYYLFEDFEILELLEKYIGSKWILALAISILVTLIMFIVGVIKFPKVIFIIITTELIYRGIIKGIKVRNKNSLLK